MPKQNLWFKRRKYGWGWTPVTWQGWLIVGFYTSLVIFSAVALLPKRDEDIGIVYIVVFGLFFLSLTSFLIGVSYRKGQAPRWQWGEQSNIDSEKDEKTKRG